MKFILKKEVRSFQHSLPVNIYCLLREFCRANLLTHTEEGSK